MSELRCPECGALGAQCEDTLRVHRHICPTCGYETVFRGRSPECVLPTESILSCSIHDAPAGEWR